MDYPAHDYKGDTVSTIGEERAYNPRLQVKSAQEYIALMSNLNLTNPKMEDEVGGRAAVGGIGPHPARGIVPVSTAPS